MTGPADLAGAAECVRCRRSEADHLLRDRDQADDIKRRIWRALGAPCAEFTDQLAAVFAANQGRVSRWSTRPAAPPAAPPSAPAAAAARGAAAARAALLARRNNQEDRHG